MNTTKWTSKLFKKWFGVSITSPTRKRCGGCRLAVETLEDRLAPAAGALDLGFGSNGTVTADFQDLVSIQNAATSLAIQADGKIVAATVADNGSGSAHDFGVARYNADGRVDATF